MQDAPALKPSAIPKSSGPGRWTSGVGIANTHTNSATRTPMPWMSVGVTTAVISRMGRTTRK